MSQLGEDERLRERPISKYWIFGGLEADVRLKTEVKREAQFRTLGLIWALGLTLTLGFSEFGLFIFQFLGILKSNNILITKKNI